MEVPCSPSIPPSFYFIWINVNFLDSLHNVQMVTAQLISAFGLATKIVNFLYFLNLKFQTSSHLLYLTAGFVTDLVGNPEDRFSQDVAHMMIIIMIKTRGPMVL